MSGRCWSRRSKPTRGSVAADLSGQWTHCLYCRAPLTAWSSREDGFGAACYVRLDARERRAIVAAAVRAREVGDLVVGYSGIEMVKFRLGLLKLH